MQRAKRHLRFFVALLFLTSAFLLSIQFSDKGIQFDLKTESSAAPETSKKSYKLSALTILNSVLLHLKDNYVEPQRINPSKMLISALDEIQNAIAEVVVTHDGDVNKEGAKSVTISVVDKTKTFDVRNIASLWEMSFQLKSIFTFIEQSLEKDPDIKFQDIEYAAINGMLSTLDPHSNLLPPQNYEEMQTQTGGKFGGLGIVISVRDGKLMVISPIDGTPASRKGIKAQDHIVRIGEESTVNMSTSEAVGLLRGKEGTTAVLWIQREGWSEPKRFDVKRAIIKIESVDSQALANKVGYLRIKNFQANTYSDTKKHLAKLKKKMGGMQGLVLDLRDNPGGLLDQSIRISDLFLNEGTIVSTVGKGNKLRQKTRARSLGTEDPYPIIVLVNSGSASASEIVSGALQNNNRGIVLGNTSFGKGSVQVLYEFQDSSALKLTIAQYLTPGGISIQGKGIVPDLRVIPATVAKKDVDMFRSTQLMREGDLATALKSDKIAKTDLSKNALFVRYFKEQEKEDPKAPPVDPDKFKEDFEIRLAQKLIVAAGKTFERKAMLTAVAPELKRVAQKEQKEIDKALKGVGVDWSKGTNPATPTYTMSFKTDAKDGVVKAGDKLNLTATLTNTGAAPLYRIKAISKSDNRLFSDQEFVFGKVEPGKSRSWTVEFKSPKDADTRQDPITFAVSDETRSLSTNDGLTVTTKGQDKPHFAFDYEVVDANKDGLLQPGEDVKLRVFVKNTGEAPSKEPLVYLKNKSGKAIYLKRGREKLKDLAPGKTKHVDFSFKVADKSTRTDPIKMEIDVYDINMREFTQKEIKLPLGGALGLKPVKSKGLVLVPAQTAIYTAPDAASKPLVVSSMVPNTMTITHEAGPWYKGTVAGRSGWVLKSKVQKNDGAIRGATLNYFEKPTLSLSASQLLTKDDSIKLTATIDDASGIKDYYVFVYNRDQSTINTKKVMYKRARATGSQVKRPTQVTFMQDIPLFKGMNRVAVYARDLDGMTSVESAYVYKK